MPRQITLGALSPESSAAEDLTLPIISNLAPLGIITNALDKAAVERRGVVITSDKGTGKSVALGLAIDQHHEAETNKEDADASYRVRRVVLWGAARGESYRAVLVSLLAAITGSTPTTRVRGRTKTDDELRSDLVAHAVQGDVAVIAVDEADRLSDDGLIALRDILTDAESGAPDRCASGHIRAGGIGVLALGTSQLRVRIERSNEAGQRWAACTSIPPLPLDDIPPIYLAFFPKFTEASRELGQDSWHRYVLETVARGRPTVSLRLIENHAREYFRLAVRNPAEVRVSEYTRKTIPFDRDLFTYAASQVNWTMQPEGDRRVG